MQENQPKEGSGIQLLDRIIKIIETVSLYPMGVSLGELAKKAGLNKSTVFRIAGALSDQGYLIKDEDGKYHLTMRLYEIGLRIFGDINIIDLIRPRLQELAMRSGECVHFGYIDGTDVVYVDKIDPTQNYFRISTKIGNRNPAYATAMGKALISHMPEEQQRKLWESAKLTALTPNTITVFEEMQKELKEICERGYAVDHEEVERGVGCIGVAVTDFEFKPRYAISISVPAVRLDEELIQKLYPLLRECARQISLFLGKKEC